MNREIMERRRESVTRAFVATMPRARVIRTGVDFAVIRTGGLSPAQRRFHRNLTILTVGLWYPIYWIVELISDERTWILIVSWNSGEVEIREDA